MRSSSFTSSGSSATQSPKLAKRTASVGAAPTPGSPHFASRRTSSGLGPLPPPPLASHGSSSQKSHYSQSIAKSMTIEEMRELHHRALSEAEAKRTELRLVLASRYRELVGSSDEVIRMKERSQELHELVHALPSLVKKLKSPGSSAAEEAKTEEKDSKSVPVDPVLQTRQKLSLLPRLTYRALDANDIHKATLTLIELFTLIASQTDAYALANVLSTPIDSSLKPTPASQLDPALETQMRMIFLQVQTLPDRITRIVTKKLLRSASYGRAIEDPTLGAYETAAALSSLHLLTTEKKTDSAGYLLDLYFDSKAKLLVALLNKLQAPKTDEEEGAEAPEGQAEQVLSKIVLLLQYDALLHPYQIFVLQNVPSNDFATVQRVMSSMPNFDKSLVRSKCSRFMATHLPLIRTKVKSVLVSIAGTTASALGKIRQSLYDRTDGAEIVDHLNSNGVCSWDDAVDAMVDARAVLNSPDIITGSSNRFSLWNVLFSNTFSSLVHSLLTTSFQSVHTRVVSTLRTSLASAPPLDAILPHEAYRNTLQIATDLDRALLKVSDDAHELLVHAEERVESERRLKESLYVHSCEILGRLVQELRRLVNHSSDGLPKATKELIVGRLCYLLKFRLTALPKLLDPESSPASMRSTTGMISYVDLQSAFELGDHDEDGIISFEEAMQAVESAFSGTQFHGAEMVRETLLLPNAATATELKASQHHSAGISEAPEDVTLDELVLLTARGLRHEATGTESALGAFQRSLDKIVDTCFAKWADVALELPSENLSKDMRAFMRDAVSVSEQEWLRLFSGSLNASVPAHQGKQSEPVARNVSPHLVGYLLAVSSVLNCSTCGSDSLMPVPSSEYGTAMGLKLSSNESIPTLMHTLRWALLRQSLTTLAAEVSRISEKTKSPSTKLEKCCPSSLVQLKVDVSFILHFFFERNRNGFGPSLSASLLASSEQTIKVLSNDVDRAIRTVCGVEFSRTLDSHATEKLNFVLDLGDLFFASLLGETKAKNVSPAGELVGSIIAGSEPLFHMPLTSSRRFTLLPVPADRTISEIQMRGKFARDKQEVVDRQEATTSVVTSGLGFLSSMLKNR